VDAIPLDAADRILATFGITSPTELYERRAKPEGFSVDDFSEVLGDSRFVFVADDSIEPYEDLVELAAVAMRELGVPVELERDEDGAMAAMSTSHGDGGVVLRLDEAASCDVCERLVRAMQSVAPQWVEFRRRPGDADGDCWIYGVLAPDEWRELEASAETRDVIRRLFEPLPPS
jgi:hypothetical protein